MKNVVKKGLWLICLLLPFFSSGQDLANHFKNSRTSRYFVFHYNDDITEIEDLAAFSDGFIDVINRNFFKAEFPYPIGVYVLKDRPSFKRFLTGTVGIRNPPDWGIYLAKIRSFVTYEGSGYGTFAHEIMHPLIHKNLPAAPVWADEGIPSFFEKSFGYRDQGQLVLCFGFQNPWRIKELGNRIPDLDLESIVRAKGSYGTSEKRLVSVFLYKNGLLERYINLVQQNQKNGYGTFFEAAFQKGIADIVPLWKTYLQDVYARRDEIFLIPGSEIFDSKDQYEAFMKKNHLNGK